MRFFVKYLNNKSLTYFVEIKSMCRNHYDLNTIYNNMNDINGLNSNGLLNSNSKSFIIAKFKQF